MIKIHYPEYEIGKIPVENWLGDLFVVSDENFDDLDSLETSQNPLHGMLSKILARSFRNFDMVDYHVSREDISIRLAGFGKNKISGQHMHVVNIVSEQQKHVVVWYPISYSAEAKKIKR